MTSGSYAVVATLGANATSYSDTGLSALTAYTYRVQAVTPAGTVSSNEATAMTPGGPPVAGVYFIHTDQLDTPRVIADGQPTTVWRWDNDYPFGGHTPNEDPDGDTILVTCNLRFRCRKRADTCPTCDLSEEHDARYNCPHKPSIWMRLNFLLIDMLFFSLSHGTSGLEECQQVGIELLLVSLGQAMGCACIDLQSRVFDEFR